MFTFRIIYSVFIDGQILSSFYTVTQVFSFALVKTWETPDFLFCYLLGKKMVDPEVNFSKATLTYLYSPLIFALLLSTSLHVQWRESAKCPVSREVKDCRKQQHTAAEIW